MHDPPNCCTLSTGYKLLAGDSPMVPCLPWLLGSVTGTAPAVSGILGFADCHAFAELAVDREHHQKHHEVHEGVDSL